MNARECAYISLKRYVSSQKYLNIEADSTIKRMRLQDAEKNLYTALFYGTVERQITLDYDLRYLCSRPLEQLDENVLLILRMSLYQLYYLDRIPPYAVLQEAGNLTRRFAARNAVSFVNGVLRSAQRQQGKIPLPADEIQRLSVLYSTPEWLCRLWQNAYGADTAEKILQAFDRPAPITLHCNTLKTTVAEQLQALERSGIAAHALPQLPRAVRLEGSVPVEKLTGLDAGMYFVQDAASQMCVEIFAPRRGERILDACACPGGKSFAAALCMENEGEIHACDLHENKLSLIRRGAQRLGISVIRTEACDGTEHRAEMDKQYDRVLCDVPCSGLGVLAKKPEIRHRTEESIARLPQIQYRILENCASYVRPGGILQYSTCTLNPAENEENVRRFLQAHPSFTAQPFAAAGREWTDGMMTVFPHETDCDGFFVAKMKRTEP